MQAMIINNNEWFEECPEEQDNVAKWAYHMADHMIEEGEKE